VKEKQPPLYLITGIVIGILVGLLISYVILPVRYTDTQPATLSADQKAVFRALVARAYLYEGDRGRAFSRLALLDDNNLSDQLVEQAQQIVAANGDTTTARGLALLASAMTNPGMVVTPLPAQGLTPTLSLTKTTATPVMTNTPILPTATPFATFTPRPTATQKATQGPPYQLVNTDPAEQKVCQPGGSSGLLMVYVTDSSGNGVSGVQIEISVPDGGQSYFFTGFYPEINPGYADFKMLAGETYRLRVGAGGEIVSGLTIPQCQNSDGSNYAGSLRLNFKQP
jgi:hypothetical protein